MQIFTHSPRSWATRPIEKDEIAAFKRLRRELDINPVYSHASYLINIASDDRSLREKSVHLLKEEMRRADMLGLDYVVLHTGTAHDQDGKRRASKSIKEVLRDRKSGAGLLIENTSGKRGDIASSIEEIAWLFENSGGLAAGICIDSCHAFVAGYDLRKSRLVGRLARDIERLIGQDMVKLIHLNDSKGEAGSRLDRHEHIGTGKIGLDGLKRLITHKLFAGVPIVLETPKQSDADDIANLAEVRKMLSKRKAR